MPIDPEVAVGQEFGRTEVGWGVDEIILYHLGIGAGNPPTDPSELAYTYEGADLKVIPSFATIPSIASMLGIAGLPGIDVNLAMLLHGEHEVELHRPIPLNAQAKNVSKIAAVYDKGKGAVMHVETITSDASGPVFTNRAALFIRGEGGFGGESGPQKSISRPHRDADLTIESPTLPQQALLYRLSGDRNPLHADPAFAALGGFDRPILHGLCSFGVILKAVVDGAFESDPAPITRYRARFAGVVFPGETIVTSVWKIDEGLFVEASTKDRATPVLTNGFVTTTG